MSFLLPFIIIFVVILLINKNAKNTSGKKPNGNAKGRPQQQRYSGMAVQQNRPQNDILSRAKQNVTDVANDDDFMREKAKRRERLQEKLSERKQAQQTAGGQPVHPGDVQQRHEHDRIQQNVEEIISDGSSNMEQYEMIASGEWIRQVEDLMIKGYEVKLPAQRDFIAEGMDMLYRFEVQ